MATTANPPPGAFALEEHDGLDPFLANAQRHRYSAFDKSQFSLSLNGSPEQAKRALEAHLSETTRRLQETSHIGKSLLDQKAELEERLKEVEAQQANDEIKPELRQKIAELQREFQEVGRETARVFLPKSRVPSGETDSTAGASVFSSEAVHSPTKVSVPSRKQRNQQPSRVNDIALATEISTSLLQQLRELQSVLLEKEELLKAADLDRSQLEIEVEGLSQRLRALDESENRLKDVNWNLETQVRELETSVKAAADRETRVNHSLKLVQSEKSTLERDLEELKQLHAKLNDDHIAKAKHHESELAGLRRNFTVAESERGTLQRKVDELALQNQELAKAMTYRVKLEEPAQSEDTSPDDGADEGDTMTPEQSPPVSPAKPTPRHGQLESETLRHSLNHAHRMIQQLKNNIHREKTEKLELKRMLQDTRDELETTRNSANGLGSASKRRRKDKEEFKKPPRPDRLGAFRMGSQEIVMVDDDEWEEQEPVQSTPSRRPRNIDSVPGAFPSGFSSAMDTATETSDAFETANEREGTATETDAFQTGAETLDGDSSEDLTETEGGRSMGTIRARRPSALANINHRDSYESTASTSGDEAYDMDVRTPVQSQQPRYKLKMRQPGYRRSTPRASQEIFSDAPTTAKDSPSSLANSNNSTPAQGRSLFAELGSFSGAESEDGSVAEGTPSRSSMLSPESSPEAIRRATGGRSPLQSVSMPRAEMVDSETMTGPWIPEGFRHLVVSSIMSNITEPRSPPQPSLHVSSLPTQTTQPRSPPQPSLSSLFTQTTQPRCPPPPSFSSLSTQTTEPRSPPRPSLQLLPSAMQDTEPRVPRLPSLDVSTITTQDTVPKAPLLPSLEMSTVSTQGTDPISPVVERPIPVSLDLSAISQQTTEPRAISAPSANHPASVLVLPVSTQSTEPVEVSPSMPVLHAASVSNDLPDSEERVEGVPLQMSALSSQTTAPAEVIRPKPELSALISQATEPLDPPKPARLQLSTLASQATAPREPPTPSLPQLSVVSAQATEPVTVRKAPSQFSRLVYQTTSPLEPKPARLQVSMPVVQATEPIEPFRPLPYQVSAITAQTTSPVAIPVSRPPMNRFSDVMVLQDTQPESPTLPAFLPTPSRPSTAHRVPLPSLSLSSIVTQETAPSVPSRPTTAHRIIPGPVASWSNMPHTAEKSTGKPEGGALGFFNSVLPWSTNGLENAVGKEHTPVLAQSGRIPLAPVASNAVQAKRSSSPVKAARQRTVDEGTQTMVSADQIDRLLQARGPQRNSNSIAAAGADRPMSPPSSPRKTARRLSSASSIRSRTTTPPPLPPDHKQLIAAAALRAPSIISNAGSEMGPPIMPASAYKKRPETPTLKATTAVNSPKTGGTTPRPRYHAAPRSDVGRSGASSPLTHRSSVSSFASELDRTFQPGSNPFAASGLDPNTTDPRMIQAITQTMIGEFLWKYTRKGAGREGFSENRHRRFFWVHPYTRTLYWSDHDPASADQAQLKSKSVPIQAVHEVVDDNPYPPGLHVKSLVITTPGRAMKFTATTGQRHETWFNALDYLLNRTGEEKAGNVDEQVEATDEIRNEFNPGFRSTSRQTDRSRTSSFFSRRTSSPHHTQIPTLRHPATPSIRRAQSTEPGQESPSGRMSSLSGMFRPSPSLRASFASRRSRVGTQEATADEQPNQEAKHDLAHEMILKAVRDKEHEPAMENVRACCDGKHDVGHLHHHSQKGRHSSYHKTGRTSVAASVSSRSHSRAESRRNE